MANGRLYTIDEDIILETHWPDINSICEKLSGRSFYSVQSRGLYLGFKLRKVGQRPINIDGYPKIIGDILLEARRKGFDSRNQFFKAAGMRHSYSPDEMSNPTLDTISTMCAAVGCHLVLVPIEPASNRGNTDETREAERSN